MSKQGKESSGASGQRAVIVTGASSGIGSAIALHLAEAGYDLFLSGRSAEGLRSTTEAISNVRPAARVGTELFDVGERGALARYVSSVGKAHPYLFAMINNAGVMHPEPILDGRMDRWRAMMDINYFAPLEGAVAAVEVMRAHGRAAHIINVSSIAAGMDTMGPYAASKRALEIVSSTLRVELENDNIRVMILVPGVFATNLGRDLTPAMAGKLFKAAGTKGINLAAGPDSRVLADPAYLARAVLYVLEQPTDINVERLVVRPPIDLSF